MQAYTRELNNQQHDPLPACPCLACQELLYVCVDGMGSFYTCRLARDAQPCVTPHVLYKQSKQTPWLI